MKTKLLACCLMGLIMMFPALAAAKTYVVGIEPAFPPWASVSQGKYQGIAPDAVRAMAKQQGFNVKFKSMPFSSLIPALKAGKIDILATGLTVSANRAKKIDFTVPWWQVKIDALVKKSSNKNMVTALCCGANVGAQTGSTDYKWLEKNLVKKGVKIHIRTYSKGTTAIRDLKIGRINTYFLDNNTARKFLNKNSKSIRIAGQVDPQPPMVYALGVQKGNKKLLKILNRAEIKLYKSGKFAKIVHKYLPNIAVGKVPAPMPSDIPSYHQPVPGLSQK